ncbi:MAG: Rpn family recombination-promoting nuclease/putative transposase [Bdellovibrionales bacterium]|nr:Rpn family recombination-promoting nuclease/putative transposase [Bdellovibrionales bacterium]
MKEKQNQPAKQIGHHDKFFKSLYSNPDFALELFRLIFSKEEIKAYNWKQLKPEKDTFPDGSRADLVFSVPLRKKLKTRVKIFILLEHKAKYDIQLFRQLFRYQTLLIEENLNQHGKPMPIIPVVFYHGKRPWKWNLSFQAAFLGKDFLEIPALSRKSMLNFEIRLLDAHDPKLDRVFKDQSFKSRGALYLLREVWSSKADLDFLRRFFGLSQDILGKHDKLILSVIEYLATGYKIKPEIWRKAEAEAVKQGLLKKGGYMDIRKHIEERGHEKGLKKGLREGRQEGRQEVVLNMLQNKLDVSLICKVTGLSEKEINKLKNGS